MSKIEYKETAAVIMKKLWNFCGMTVFCYVLLSSGRKELNTKNFKTLYLWLIKKDMDC